MRLTVLEGRRVPCPLCGRFARIVYEFPADCPFEFVCSGCGQELARLDREAALGGVRRWTKPRGVRR